MTTANDEFMDMMPHRIEVTPPGNNFDDRGRPIASGETRTYACLLDDAAATSRTVGGTEVDTVFTAYVAPVPLDPIGAPVIGGEPVDIQSTELVIIVVPFFKLVHVTNIEHHYDSEEGVGKLHNIVLRFNQGSDL